MPTLSSGGKFENNWKNILGKLRSVLRTEYGNTLPIFIGDEDSSSSSQYIRLDPQGSELSQYMITGEMREFTVNVFYVFSGVNVKKTALDHILRFTSRTEALIHDNISMTLDDDSSAFNCRFESTELGTDEEENVYVVSWVWMCQHLGNASDADYSTKSLAFDGANDYLEIGNKSDFNFGASTDFTVSLWAKYTGDGYMGLVSKGVGSVSGGWEVIINLSTGKLQGRIEDSDGSPTLNAISTGEYNDGAWHNFVVVFDRSGFMTLYIDGNVDGGLGSGTVDISSGGDCDATHSLIIGKQSVGSTYYTGNIDEVSIWNTALAQSAIAELYNSGKPKDIRLGAFKYLFDIHCKGYWRMGDGTLDTYPLIADQTNPTLGAELWDSPASTNGSVTNWTAYDSGGTYNLLATDSEAVKITFVDSSNEAGAYTTLRSSKDLSSDLVQYALYKFSCDAKVNTGSVSIDTSDPSSTTATVTETSFTRKTIYFRATSTNADVIKMSGMGSGEIIYLDNFSLKLVNGNPGMMTNMTSADIETETP